MAKDTRAELHEALNVKQRELVAADDLIERLKLVADNLRSEVHKALQLSTVWKERAQTNEALLINERHAVSRLLDERRVARDTMVSWALEYSRLKERCDELERRLAAPVTDDDIPS